MQPRISRRTSLRMSALGALGVLSGTQTTVAQTQQLAKPLIKMAGYSYDRVRAIQDGRVRLDEFDVAFATHDIYSLNRHVFGPAQTYEVSETGLIPFVMKYANEDFRAYTLIPVFISRTFRHRNIYVRTDANIQRPQDLRGRRVGTPGYAMSSHTWIRGILQDVYGVRPDEMQWIEATASSDGGQLSSDYAAFFLPADFPIKKGPPGVDESELILSGQVDALITAIEPKAYKDGNPLVRRLFPDYESVEREYFRSTRVFPIMHAVAVRKEFVDAHPDLPAALFRLYSQAKQAAYADLATVGALKISLPWVNQELSETQALMGDNYWKYGVQANRKELELVMRYTYEQGLLKRRLRVEEVFHPTTLELVED